MSGALAQRPTAVASPARWRPWVGRAVWTVVAVPAAATLILAVVGPRLAPHRVAAIVGPPYEPGGPGLPLGTDHLGRDVLSGVLCGARGIMLVPLAAVAVGTLLGVPLGLLTGWRAGRSARLVLVLAELVLVLPPLLVVLIALDAQPSTIATVSVVGVLGAVNSIRYLRTATARAAASGYVEHALALGESRGAVLLRELVPALLGPILADAGLRLVGAVYLVASLSFLGVSPLGGQDWASMVAANADAGGLNTAALLAPGLCIVVFAASVNLLADRAAARLRSQR